MIEDLLKNKLVKDIRAKIKKEVSKKARILYTPSRIKINPRWAEDGIFDSIMVNEPDYMNMNERAGGILRNKEFRIIKGEVTEFAKKYNLLFAVTKEKEPIGSYSPLRGWHDYLYFNRFPKSFDKDLYIFFIENQDKREIENIFKRFNKK